MSGTIKLIWKGFINNHSEYDSPKERKKIIEQWRVVYGEKFKECAIQAKPKIVERKEKV